MILNDLIDFNLLIKTSFICFWPCAWPNRNFLLFFSSCTSSSWALSCPSFSVVFGSGFGERAGWGPAAERELFFCGTICSLNAASSWASAEPIHFVTNFESYGSSFSKHFWSRWWRAASAGPTAALAGVAATYKMMGRPVSASF